MSDNEHVQGLPPDRQLFTTVEVAGILRVNPRTVQGWAEDGLIEAIRLPSGRLRFTREVLETLLARHSHRPPSDG